MSFERNERTVPPEWFNYEGGHFALVSEDVYFQEDEIDAPRGQRFDRYIQALAPIDRECLELTVFGRLSYRDAARFLGWFSGDPPGPDGKKVWRYATRGLKQVRAMMEEDEGDASLRV